MSITARSPGGRSTFSANSSSSARSCSISSLRVGALHLDDHALAVRERRRGGPGRSCRRRAGCGVDVLEHVLPGHAELLLHHADDLLLGERRHVVLQRRELLDELGRQQVGAGRHDLAELREGRSELLERRAQPLAPAGAGPPRPPRRAARTAPCRPCFAKTAAIFEPRAIRRGSVSILGVRAARTRRRTRGRGRRGGRAVGRVHDDHGAAGVVADPVRHVAEQELLASGHARVPDDEHVDGVVLGGLHDRHRRVVVDHDVRARRARRRSSGVGLQVVGRGARLGGVGGAELGVGRARGHDHLDDVQLGAERVGERRRPAARRARRSRIGRSPPSRAGRHRWPAARLGDHGAHHGGSRRGGQGGGLADAGWCRHRACAGRADPVGILDPRARRSSSGQSNRLVSGRSGVRIPPPALSAAALARRPDGASIRRDANGSSNARRSSPVRCSSRSLVATHRVAQTPVDPGEVPERNDGGWVCWLAWLCVIMGGVLVLFLTVMYMRYAPRSKDDEVSKVVFADRVTPGQEPPRRTVDLSQAVADRRRSPPRCRPRSPRCRRRPRAAPQRPPAPRRTRRRAAAPAEAPAAGRRRAASRAAPRPRPRPRRPRPLNASR